MKSSVVKPLVIVLAILLPLAALVPAKTEAEEAPADSASISVLRHQIEAFKRQSDEQRKQFDTQMEQQRRLLETLQQRLNQIQGQTQQAATKSQQEAAQTREQLQSLQEQVKAGPSSVSFANLLENYYGEHRFMITGGAATTFSYDRERNVNSFGLLFEPIFLFRPATWLLFEAEPSFVLPASGGTDVGLEFAQADIFATDYLQITAGKFLLPFGDFIEGLHPFWINEFVSRPLPFRDTGDGGLLPFSDLGVQVRGAYQWGETGQVVDYAAWMGNGPAYDTSLPVPVVGQAFTDNNISTTTHTRSIGGRLRVHPIPVSARWAIWSLAPRPTMTSGRMVYGLRAGG
jgi:hypothetical protein